MPRRTRRANNGPLATQVGGVFFVRPITETRLLAWLPLNSMFRAAFVLAAVLAIQRLARRPQQAF